MKKIKKLKLNKETISNFETYSNDKMQNIRGGNFDFPTINDNCLYTTMPPTFASCIACDPKEWCGWNHETDCHGPFITRG